MKHKEVHVLIMFIFILFIFLYLTQPSYIGYTPQNNTDTVTVFQDKIDILQSLQEDSDKLEILQILNIDLPTTISALYDYGSQVQTIEQDTTLNDTEKQDMILNLETQADDLLAELPKLLTITNKISGLPATPVSDIKPEMLPEGIDTSLIEEILYLQEQVEARTDVRVFSILTFSGEESSGTYIKKTINAPIQSGYVLEIMPSTLEELNFLGEYEVINQNPLTLSIKMSNKIALYSYIISKDIFTSIDQIQTAAIPYEIKIEPIIEVVCDDGICTEHLEDEITCPEDCASRMPWLLIISIVLILIAGILFIHFFRHKLKRLFQKEEALFKTETDKENLKNYIKASLNEDIKEEQIKSVLLAKGWTEKQVDFVFDEINQEKQKELSKYRESTPIGSETEKLKSEEETAKEE